MELNDRIIFKVALITSLVGIIGIIYLMKKGQKVTEETRMKLF